MTIIDLRLDAPAVHGEFGPRTGNATPLRRMPALIGDEQIMVPCISGNALRGRLRRIVMSAALDAIHPDGDTPDGVRVALVGGGKIAGTQKTPPPDEIRALRAAVPPLSVLGASLTSWMLPGRVDVGFGWPVCDATVAAGLVTVSSETEPVPAVADIETEIAHVRLPDRTELDDLTPMPHTFEAFIPGVRLQSDLHFHPSATLLERACVLWGFSRLTRIGGKHASGFGAVTATVVAGSDDRWAAELFDAWLTDRETLDAAQSALTDLGL